MATNQTTNYQLNQWEPTDQVLRTDFNADNAKIDIALANSLQKCEYIKSLTLTTDSQATLDLSDINWNEWSVLGFFFDLLTVGSANPPADIYYQAMAGQGSPQQYCSELKVSYLACGKQMPTLVMLLPLRDSTRKVHSVYLGALSGVGYAECTYADLQNLLIRTTYVFHPTYSFSLWGIR